MGSFAEVLRHSKEIGALHGPGGDVPVCSALMVECVALGTPFGSSDEQALSLLSHFPVVSDRVSVLI